MTLEQFFEDHPSVAIAFSGGVDSSYLLYEACRNGARVGAYFVKSAFQPDFELDDAMRLAQQLGAQVKLLQVDVLSHPEITGNPKNRCYYCKYQIFRAIQNAAAQDGFPVILDGTNASDDASDRPGMQALREMGVLSPLRICGLTKSQIRQNSREAGIFTWNKPAYACLATRIPTGEEITEEKLSRTQWAEAYLFSLGFRDFRVRSSEDLAKIQVREDQINEILEFRREILRTLKKRYRAVVLDLEVRKHE